MDTPNFRAEHSKITAHLVRKFGPHHLDDILDATQEAFITAHQSWPHHGTPLNPTGWLITTAERRLIDQLRHKIRLETIVSELPINEVKSPDELHLFFLLCSPKLSYQDQICLMLRTLGGLNSAEIARLLHQSEEAIQRRITRAKSKLNPADLTTHPTAESITAILKTLYLLFTEGYETARGPDHIRPDLARQALVLTAQLALHTKSDFPEVHALKALIHFNISRFPARTTSENLPIFLADQDPAQYDQHQIQLGFQSLEQAFQTTFLTQYHLEAGLAAAISLNAPAEEILNWHEQLVSSFPTPNARLSHAIALGEAQGPPAALAKLATLTDLIESPYYHAALGYFQAKVGQNQAAAESYRRATSLTMSLPMKQALTRTGELLSPD
jgi:RNA polymerase sigma factor (sigma-70 family)